MSIAKKTKKYVNKLDDTKIFTYRDISPNKKTAVTTELSRLYKKGIINKISKGKFYKPKKGIFGDIEPSNNEKISSYIDNISGLNYETGINSFRRLGLTTQIVKTITIATNQSYKKIKIDNIQLKIVFKRIEVPKKDIILLQILDALKDIKKIPATTPQKTFISIERLIERETEENQQKLVDYALKYTPRTRALVGAILKNLGFLEKANYLKETLNSKTKYKIGIDIETLPSKNYWNII